MIGPLRGSVGEAARNFLQETVVLGYEVANDCYSDAPHGEQFISATRFVTEDQMAATVRLLEHLHLDTQRPSP